MSGGGLYIVFPGQGSQRVGMLSELARQFPQTHELFEEASAVLGYSLWDLIENGPEEALRMTEKTQPALLAAGVAWWRAFCELGKDSNRALVLAGHSLGEFTALVCAEALHFSDAIQLVAQRGRFMQECVSAEESAMVAILGLEQERVDEICRVVSEETQRVAELANINASDQLVIAGHKDALESASARCLEQGAKRAISLSVSAPFHTSLMRPAGERLGECLKSIELAKPRIPVIHNVHAQAESDPVQIKRLLVDQASRPVQWVAVCQKLAESGAESGVECGPGKVLTALARRNQRQLTCVPIESMDFS